MDECCESATIEKCYIELITHINLDLGIGREWWRSASWTTWVKEGLPIWRISFHTYDATLLIGWSCDVSTDVHTSKMMWRQKEEAKCVSTVLSSIEVVDVKRSETNNIT
jgi:hypothetical protein